MSTSPRGEDPASELEITPTEWKSLFNHLSHEFRGMYDKQRIKQHITDYVGKAIAQEQVRQVLHSTPTGADVLDVGCGFGTFVLVARDTGLSASGIDIADFELQFARERLARERPDEDPALTYVKGDALALPFPNESFDAVTLWNVLEHVPSYKRLLQEAHRVVRPFGRVYVVAPNYGAFRKEAHYHVPWLPFLHKRIASVYLRTVKRDPTFLTSSVFYCTNRGVHRALAELGVKVENPKVRKLLDPALIENRNTRRLVTALRDAHLLPLLLFFERLRFMNPFKKAIDLEATKTAGMQTTPGSSE